MNRRSRLEKMYNRFYKKLNPVNSDDSFTCYYCGEPANCYDHTPPISCIDYYDCTGIEAEFLLVPSCSECNRLLGSTNTKTLADRFTLLKELLRKHYSKVLKSTALWSDKELRELMEDPNNLNNCIVDMCRIGNIASKRIDYPGFDIT